MTRALVVDADAVGRNLVRVTLERFGLSVTAAADARELGDDFSPSGYDVISIDAGSPGDPGEQLAQDLRATGWQGALVLTTESIGHWSLTALKSELAPSAIFAKPLVREELELRLEKLLPTICDEDDELGVAWNGALKSERKRFAREVPDRGAALLDALHEARRDPTTARLERASKLACSFADDAERNRMHGLAEVCRAIGEQLVTLDRSADPDAWRRINALAEVIRGVPLDRVLAERTIDDAMVYRHDTIALIVHPDLGVLLAAAEIAERHHVGLVSARSGADALRAAGNRRFDAVFVADDLPGSGTTDLIASLREVRVDLPIGLVGGHATSTTAAGTAPLRAPINLRLPLDESAFVGALTHLTHQRVERRRRVLLAESDEALARSIVELLSHEGLEVVRYDGNLSIDETLAQVRPDLVLAELLGPIVSGLEICRQIRAVPRWSTVPVVLLTQEEEDLAREACLRVGADDLIPKPISAARLLTTVLTRTERFRAYAHLDPDLGILRRSAFFERTRGAVATIGEAVRSVTVGLIDVRDLSGIVSAYGFEVGDRALELVARTAQAVLGPHVDVARYGGDQIAVLLPGESTSSATALLLRVVDRLEHQVLLAGNGRDRVHLAVAWGAAGSDRVGANADRIVSAAERALRERKTEQDGARTDLGRTLVG